MKKLTIWSYYAELAEAKKQIAIEEAKKVTKTKTKK